MAEARRDLADVSLGRKVAERALLVDLHMGAPGIHRKISKGRVQTTAEKRLVKADKKILESPEYDAAVNKQGQTRDFLRRRAFRGVVGRGGMYLLPLDDFEAVDVTLQGNLGEIARLADVATATYEARAEETRANLGDIARVADYCTQDEFRRGFVARLTYITFAVPGNLPDAVQARARGQLDALWEEIGTAARYVLREGFAELVDHAVDRLNGGKKVKTFKNKPWTAKWDEFFWTFAGKDLTDDAELAKLVGAARMLVAGVDPQDLKDDGRLRRKVLAGMQQVKVELDGLLEDAPVRMIRED